MTIFIIGVIVGTLIGVAVMCLMNAASDADDEMEKYQNEREPHE